VVCVGIGGALLARGIFLRRRLLASQDWPHVDGIIAQSSIVERLDPEGDDYSVALLYHYAVGGQGYSGKRIGFSGRAHPRRSQAEQELAQYPVNGRVTVYYDPSNPSDCVLQRESPGTMLYLILGAAMFSFGGVIGILGMS